MWSVVRDRLQTLPVAVFSQRNMVAGSLSIDYLLPTEATSDAVRVEYFSGVVWDFRTVVAQFHNGVIYHYVNDADRPSGVPAPRRITRIRIPGIIGRTQALREARYTVATNVYRRTFVSWTAEADGRLPGYGSLIAIGHDMPQWGQSGDVVAWNSGTRVMTLSEDPVFTTGENHYIRIQRPNGSLSDVFAVTAVSGQPSQVLLATSPDFRINPNSATQERPRYIFGATDEVGVLASLLAINPSMEGTTDMYAVVEDARVHNADVALLPAPGETQDPMLATAADAGVIEDDGPGGEVPSDFNSAVLGSGIYIYNNGGVDGSFITFHTDGLIEMSASYWAQTGRGYEQWLQYVPVSAATAGQYEIRFTDPSLMGGQLLFEGSPLDTWLSLAQDRSAVFLANYPDPPTGPGITNLGSVYVEIRHAASGVVLAAQRVYSYYFVGESGGG